MRKRVSEIIAASLLCACLALAGTAALAVAGLLGDGPAAQAQESGGDQQSGGDADGEGEAQPELTEWQKARIAEYEDARDAAAGVSGQAAQGMISGLASRINEGASDSFTVSATGLNPDYWHQFIFQVRSLRSDGETHSRGGLGFDAQCDGVITSPVAPRRATTFSATLTLHACKAGTYQVKSQLRLLNHNEDPVEVSIVDTDTQTVTVECVVSPCVDPLPKPPAPSNFRVTSTGERSARLAWSAQSNISRFQISGGPRNVHPTRSSTAVTVTGLRCGTTYTFRIRADGDGTNTDGWSNWSSSVSTTTSGCPPTITISRNRSFVTEGQDAEFTLRASHASSSSISVKVSVSERGSFIKGTKPTSVTISANKRTATLTVETNDDSADENHGSVTARVLAGAGYAVGSPSYATMTVRDNDPEPTPSPTVAPTPDPTPVDDAPEFGTSIGNKIWKQNTRIPSFTLPRATGGDGTLTYSLSRGQPAGVRALPAGVSRSGRSVSGTPSGTMARTKYTWTATDSDPTDPDSATLTFYITVNADLAPAFGTTTTISDKTWTHNKAITNFTLPRATGGDGTLTYSLSRSGQSSGASALPAGVSRSAHSVSGTPSALLANTTFTWTATDSDGDKASLTFKVEVLPQVSIAAKKAEVAEGQRAEFTLTASAAPLANLAVTVRVTQSGTFISGAAPTSATISASQTTATLSVPTTKDSVDEADGSVRAEVRTGTGYAVGSAASASVSVRDTPRISIAAGTSPVTEGANATFTITAAGAPLSSIVIPVSVTQSGAFIKGTAPTRVTIAANGTSATLTVATENDATDEQNGSITATLSGNATSPYVVVSGSSSASVTVNDNDVKLATPANFTVTPLPLRKARLDWPDVEHASVYFVEIRGVGRVKTISMREHSYEIDLDAILDAKGLADSATYQFKVKSVYDVPVSGHDDDTSDPYVDSDFSSVVEIRDTPIISINGSNSSRATRNLHAVVKWNPVPGATSYTLRWRELPTYRSGSFLGLPRSVRHTDTSWRPQAASRESDWSKPLQVSGSTRTVSGLDLGDIYAFQLNYTTANGQGFSARESYVWPSNGFPSDRVATYPFFGHWENGRYEYTICQNTFPAGKQTGWVNLIKAAIGAWGAASDGIVTTVASTANDCASTSLKIVSSLNNETNEVIMVNPRDSQYDGFRAEVRQLITKAQNDRLFAPRSLLTNPEIIIDALPECIFVLHKSTGGACVISPAYVNFTGLQASTNLTRTDGSVDILITQNETLREPIIPSGIRFNACTGDAAAYELVLHESGHALGLSGFSIYELDKGNDYRMAHPTIPDSVLNYDHKLSIDEPDCSLYPFDIMAIQALYQSVN